MTDRRHILKAVAGLNAMVALGAPSSKLPDITVNEDQAKITREAFGETRIYFSGSTEQVRSITVGSLSLKSGMSPHPPHEHPEEELLLIAEGTGEISMGGKTTAAGPDSIMYCAAGHVHGIVNTGKVPMLFYFFKWKV